MIDTLAIDTGIEPEYENRLIASAKKYGWRVIYPRRVPFTDTILDVDDDLENPNVWFHGDIATAKTAQATTSWQVDADWHHLNLVNFWPCAGDLMVNDYHFETLARFYENPWYWFNKWESDHLFVKSAAADKTVSGSVMDARKFEEQWKLMTFYEPPPDTMLAIAKAQKIVAEARFLVVNGRVITGSYYKIGSGRTQLEVQGGELLETAIQMRKNIAPWFPPETYVLDLAQTFDGQWKIMEPGAVSCCGLYQCDTDKLVKALACLPQDME